MSAIEVILGGTILGGLYALVAIGLTLIYGVMRVVNIGHGDIVTLGAYLLVVLAGVVLGALWDPLHRPRAGSADPAASLAPAPAALAAAPPAPYLPYLPVVVAIFDLAVQ